MVFFLYTCFSIWDNSVLNLHLITVQKVNTNKRHDFIHINTYSFLLFCNTADIFFKNWSHFESLQWNEFTDFVIAMISSIKSRNIFGILIWAVWQSYLIFLLHIKGRELRTHSYVWLWKRRRGNKTAIFVIYVLSEGLIAACMVHFRYLWRRNCKSHSIICCPVLPGNFMKFYQVCTISQCHPLVRRKK